MLSSWLLCLFFVPPLISLGCKYLLRWDISWIEMGVQAVSGVAVLSLIWAVGNASANYDTEILNGKVTAKQAWTFACPTNTSNPCRNSYTCNCVTIPSTTCDSKGVCTTTYTTTCDTCYVYPWERNWLVSTTVHGDNGVEVPRIDRQGAYMPNRWSEIRIGEPASAPHAYKNWVRASANSLFHEDGKAEETYQSMLPTYPEITDLYRVDRILTPGFRLRNEQDWNDELSNILIGLGPNKQLNLTVVIVPKVGRDYAFALRRNWQGFKKNDAILVMGVDANYRVQWAEVMSWSKAAIFDVNMRHFLESYRGVSVGTIDPKVFFSNVSAISSKDFVRRPMKEFEYLKGSIPPPLWLTITATIVALVLGVGTSILFNNVDFDAAIFNRRPRYSY